MPKQLASVLVIVCFGFLVASDVTAQNAPRQETGWSASCLSDRVCELKSEINSGGSVAARASIFNIRGRFFFHYTIPLGVDLTQGVFIRVGEDQKIATDVANCSGVGCTGSFELTTPVLHSLKRGNKLAILFSSSITQDSFAITFSLSGFTTAFKKIVGG